VIDKTVAKDDNCDGTAEGTFASSLTRDIDKCVVYRICVDNTGDQDVNTVVVSDTNPPGGTLNFGTVAAHTSNTCMFIPKDEKSPGSTCTGGHCTCPATGTTTDTATLTGTCSLGDNACDKANSKCSDSVPITCQSCQIVVDKTVAKDDNCDGTAEG